MNQLHETIEMCFDISNTNDECDFLQNFISCVISDNEESDNDLMESKDKLFYKEVLYNDSKIRCNFENIYNCSKTAGVNWKVAEDLDWFLFYVFHRRFGWPDLEEENGMLKVILPDSQIRFRKSGKSEELKYKPQLVDMLDSIILWLSHQPISAVSLLMYSSAIRLASKFPVTRLHLSIRGYDWLKENLAREINDKLWHTLQEFLILGITDFWSRIRDAAILRLGPIIEYLELSQIFSLFDELVRLCDSNVNQWQIVDGAISAICAILKRFQKVGYKSEIIQSKIHSCISSPRFHCQIKIGDNEIDRMPEQIMSKIQFLIFKLIYHPQQTIRDNSIKAFVLCLDRYYENTQLEHLVNDDNEPFEIYLIYDVRVTLFNIDVDTAFQNVCQKLSCRPNGSAAFNNSNSNIKSSPNQYQRYIDPYGSQSLICLSHHLFKRIHDKINYLENWHHYHCYFDQYLSHPASSVRLVSSNLYTYAISQAISHPLLVKNIIHNLIIKWNPDQTVLLKSINSLIKFLDSKHRKRISVSKIESDNDISDSWEWREGRLLVFELFAKLIIKNHLWYTFGTTEVESVYSSDNTNSRLNESSLYDAALDHPINLSGSSLGINNEQSLDDTEENMLSKSLDARRTTITSFPIKNIKFKALSKRRKSHDIILRKISEDESLNKAPAMRKMSISRLNVATSTKNLHSISHSSFLLHIKEIESFEEAKLNNTKININCQNNNERKLPTFRSILSQMLHTSAESLIDSQWELRRMAKQALPPLGEVLRWYDPELLVNIINTHLKFEPTLMTAISLQLLHDSLLHTSRLKQLTTKPPSSWQPNVAMKVVSNIITRMESNLPQWMKSCQHYLDRSTVFDCITPHSINIVITCISNYSDIISAINLSKSLVEAFVRLDKDIKCHGSNFISIYSFEIYPNTPSNIISSENPALEYSVQLLDFIKQGLLGWWQKLSNLIRTRDYYDLHKEAIISFAKLMPIFAFWIYPISEMRGDNGRYIRDINKLMGFLLKLLIEVMSIDVSMRLIFATNLVQLLEVVTSYVQEKTIKLDNWWMRQLMEIMFLWIEAFGLDELDVVCRNETEGKKPILFSTLKALLQRLHSMSNRRRATVGAIHVAQISKSNTVTKRHSISENSDSPMLNCSNFIRTENANNLELFSSLAIGENLEYISDESLNDSDGEKKTGSYRESHVLSGIHPNRAHSLQLPLEFGIKKSFTLLSGKSNSSLIYEEADLEKRSFRRSCSSVNSDFNEEMEASDWDSSSESDGNSTFNSPVKADKSNDETAVISELITKIIKYNPKLYEQSKQFLPDFDAITLQGLKI